MGHVTVRTTHRAITHLAVLVCFTWFSLFSPGLHQHALPSSCHGPESGGYVSACGADSVNLHSACPACAFLSLARQVLVNPGNAAIPQLAALVSIAAIPAPFISRILTLVTGPRAPPLPFASI